MGRKRITALKGSVLNAEDRFAIANLLIKAGYSVRIVKEKPANKSTLQYYIEYWEE